MASKKVADYQFAKIPSKGPLDLGIDKIPANMPMMKDLLDSTGHGFCLAKWTQVTMHLGTGLTHSCHHPTPHEIPLEEIQANPSALHNTSHKKKMRKMMLNGERPPECSYCWRIEDNTSEFSDRVEKSLAKFSIIDHDKITESTGDEDVYPRYMEISWNNTCNFKCAYCGPSFSSRWAEEISEHSWYSLPHGDGYNWSDHLQILEREHNPYIEAFWEWFPEASQHLDTMRITGGEPLMSKHTFRVMESLLENPNPELELSINSNGCPPDKLWDRFIELTKQLIDRNCIKKFTLFTSAEAYGPQCEYIRYGMDFDVFKNNIERFLKETTGTRLVFMAAFNILSLPSFKNFLEWVLSLKKQYNHNGLFEWMEDNGLSPMDGAIRTTMPEQFRNVDLMTFKDRSAYTSLGTRVGIDIPYIREPQFLDVKIATPELIEKYLLPAVTYMYDNIRVPEWHDALGFDQMEAAKLKRILTSLLIPIMESVKEDNTTSDDWISKCRDRFLSFISEYDRRRGTDFSATFPEFDEFIRVCELEQMLQV